MFANLSTARLAQTLGISLMAGVALVFAPLTSKGEDKIQPPPYEVAGMNGVSIGVVWDEAAIRKALPHGIEPVKAMTGGINIYSAERGYVVGPYSAAYFYADIEGFDSPEGIKGRWMLAGVYGPQPKISDALRTFYGAPVRLGSSRLEPTADGKRAIGTVNGQDFVTAEFKSVPGSCQAAAVLLNYVGLSPETEQLGITRIPVTMDSCKAELVSAKVTAAPGDPFATYQVAKFTGAAEFKNGSGALTPALPAGK